MQPDAICCTALFYNARYYDPGIGRFVSADSIVPGAGSLTLSPHDAVASGAWGKPGGGPANPQDLNRYSYVLNNPIRNTDPTGHINKPEPQGGPPGGGVGGGGQVDDEDDRQRGGAQGDGTTSGAASQGANPAATGAQSGAQRALSESGTINPQNVRFSQDSARYQFKDGRTIDDLANGLKNGSVKADNVPPIRLVERDGKLYTLDNRRLEAFRRAGVDVNYRMATPKEIQKDAFKFTTRNDGVDIHIRGEPR